MTTETQTARVKEWLVLFVLSLLVIAAGGLFGLCVVLYAMAFQDPQP